MAWIFPDGNQMIILYGMFPFNENFKFFCDENVYVMAKLILQVWAAMLFLYNCTLRYKNRMIPIIKWLADYMGSCSEIVYTSICLALTWYFTGCHEVLLTTVQTIFTHSLTLVLTAHMV